MRVVAGAVGVPAPASPICGPVPDPATAVLQKHDQRMPKKSKNKYIKIRKNFF
jgi:hypothetical protein